MIEPKLDIRHQRIIKEIKETAIKNEVIVVGAGDCKKDYHLIREGFKVYSTDYKENYGYAMCYSSTVQTREEDDVQPG